MQHSIRPIFTAAFGPLLDLGHVHAVDVGARRGVHLPYLKLLPLLTIDAVEPDPVECARLQMDAPRGVAVFDVALSKESGPHTFYRLKELSGSSLYRPRFDLAPPAKPPSGYWQVDRVDTVDCLTFAAFRQQFNRPAPQLVKIDTQGSELDILQSFSAEDWEELVAIETEVYFEELYQDQPLFPEIHGFLISKGFRLFDLTRHHTFFSKNDQPDWYLRNELRLYKHDRSLVRSQWISGDAVYFRVEGDGCPVQTRSMLAAKLLACLTYGAYDLALWLLDQPQAQLLVDPQECLALRAQVTKNAPLSRTGERTVVRLGQRAVRALRRLDA